MLMRPDYRVKLDPRYAKKVESIVRKAPKGIKDFKDEIEEETMECPICDANLPNMDVTCYNCKTTLPICVATVSSVFEKQRVFLIKLFILYKKGATCYKN